MKLTIKGLFLPFHLVYRKCPHYASRQVRHGAVVETKTATIDALVEFTKKRRDVVEYYCYYCYIFRFDLAILINDGVLYEHSVMRYINIQLNQNE